MVFFHVAKIVKIHNSDKKKKKVGVVRKGGNLSEFEMVKRRKFVGLRRRFVGVLAILHLIKRARQAYIQVMLYIQGWTFREEMSPQLGEFRTRKVRQKKKAKSKKKTEPPGSGGANLGGDVHYFVHEFVIYLNNTYICTNFNNTRYGSIISQ